MTAALVLSVVASTLIGALAVDGVWWTPAGPTGSRPLLVFLALGIGLALSSVLYFGWLLLPGAPVRAFPLGELLVVGLLAGAAVYAAKTRRSSGLLVHRDPATAPSPKWLRVALWVSAACAVVAFGLESAVHPQGGWDAWMTWNMHARAIYRGADHWRAALTGLPGWSHPDYPLLVPASVSRMWVYAGGETAVASAVVGFLFTFATIGVLFAAVSILRSRSQGVLAALLLLATKFFVLDGASQFADIPVAFFFLATLALLALAEAWTEGRPRLLMLAGATAGLSAWTKNEGLLFLVAIVVGYGSVLIRARGWRAGLLDARAFGFGLVPVLALVAGFKIWLAPPNDLMSGQGIGATAGRLLEGARYVQILGGFERAFLEISAKGLAALMLLGYGLCAGFTAAGPARLAARATAVVVGLMLIGYFAVLLTAPEPLLATNVRSVNRLLLQVWPSGLLAYFLAVRTIEEAGVTGLPPIPGSAGPQS